MNEIGDFNTARKCAPITLIYQTTEDNLEPPDGNDHWCIVDRANGRTRWRLIHLSPLRAPTSLHQINMLREAERSERELITSWAKLCGVVR